MKSKSKARRIRKPRSNGGMVDATPERLAKSDHSEMVNPAEIDSSEQPIGLTRRFRSSHIDRLHKNGRLTWVQWYAGDWYRTVHARCGFEQSVVASYGERSTTADLSYGLPRTEAQVRARQLLRAARARWPADMIGYMDRLVIRDEMPLYGGRAAARNLAQIAGALNRLADWLNLNSVMEDPKKPCA